MVLLCLLIALVTSLIEASLMSHMIMSALSAPTLALDSLYLYSIQQLARMQTGRRRRESDHHVPCLQKNSVLPRRKTQLLLWSGFQTQHLPTPLRSSPNSLLLPEPSLSQILSTLLSVWGFGAVLEPGFFSVWNNLQGGGVGKPLAGAYSIIKVLLEHLPPTPDKAVAYLLQLLPVTSTACHC